MKFIKNAFACIGLTLLLFLTRFFPAVLNILFPDIAVLTLFLYLGLLYIGWLIAENISKGKHPKCIKAILYIFAILEVSGVIDAVSKLFIEMPTYSDQFYYDIYGVAYSEYPVIYGTVLLFGVAYIVLCLTLAKKTKSVAPSKAIPAAQPIEKNHEEKQKLRDEIAKLKNTLQEMDQSYETNRKILADAYSDDQLEQMVANGEFPADKVAEYIEQRKSLAMFISMHPSTRAATVKLIGDATKKLAELECQD